jgi:integrase
MSVLVKFVAKKWCLRINHKGRRKLVIVGTSKEGANTVAKEVEIQLALGDMRVFDHGLARGDAAESFQSYGARWLVDVKENLKATAWRFYNYNLPLHCDPVIGDRPIGEITRADARRLVKALRAKGCKIDVVKGACRTASAVLSQAMEDGLRTFNPFFRLGKHQKSGDQVVTTKGKVKAMSREQSQHLLQTVRTGWPWFFALYLTALRTGMRLGELLALKWDAIDFKKRTIEVRLNYTGSKFTSPKNKSLRTVEMSKTLCEELQKHLVAMKAHALKTGSAQPDLLAEPTADDSNLCFLAVEGGVIDGDNFRSRVHSLVMKAAGFRFTIKELRHTFASLLIFKSYVEGKPVTLARISRLMGHSSIQITVDRYGHFIPDDGNMRAVDCLDDELPGTMSRGAGNCTWLMQIMPTKLCTGWEACLFLISRLALWESCCARVAFLCANLQQGATRDLKILRKSPVFDCSF